jgi:heptosyltransferase I
VSLPPGARICIVMMSAVGDTVHVLPIVNALKRHDPTARITWLLQPLPASLVAGHPAIDEIILFDATRGWRAFVDAARALRKRRFDVVIDLQVAMKAGIVTALTGARRRVGFDRHRARDMNWLFTNERIPAHPPQHVEEQYIEFLRHLGVEPEPITWNLGPWREEREWQRQFFAGVNGPAAAINVATSNPDRDWMPERWVEVIDALHDRHGLRSIIVGGRSEREVAALAVISSATRHPPIDALGSGFRRLVSILDGVELVLALDSAPLHIAVALGRPVVSLMANADPRRTGPFRAYHDLIVDAYHDPGETAPVSMQRRWGRMSRITVADVLERVDRWAAHYRRRQ